MNHQCSLHATAGRVLPNRATSESTHLPMSKQINLVINGKGVVKELLRLELRSVFERLRHRSLSDPRRPRERHSQALHRSGHPRCRKDIELPSFGPPRRAASLFESSKTLLPLSTDAVIARCLPFAAPPQAPPRPSFRQRAITAVCSESLTRW